MPAKSVAQQEFFGAELSRERAGKKTQTGLPEGKLQEFAATPRKGLPQRVGQPKHHSGGRVSPGDMAQGYSRK